jgi:beta-mannosidase
VTLYRDGQQRLAEGEERLELPAHGCCERDAESLLGRFADASWAYRFGPPAHDTIVASLEPEGEGGEPICQAFRFPAGRPLREQAIEELGLVGELVQGRDGAASLTLRCRRLAYGVRIHVPGFLPADDALTLEPMVARTISLRAGAEAASASGGGTLTALNLRGHARIVTGEGADG